jgi:hypothetical protein
MSQLEIALTRELRGFEIFQAKQISIFIKKLPT